MFKSCSADRFPRLTEPNAAYQRAVSDSDVPDVPAAVEGLIALFADYSRTNVAARVRDVYADTLYFRDGFKEITNIDALEEYLVRGTEPLRSCTFDFPAIIQHGEDYYLRWVMKVSLQRDPADHVDQVIGMSHVRFDSDGRIVFQQDYWDPSDVLYRRIPVAGWLMHKVKDGL